MRLLVTGGAGFIGSHFVRWMLRRHRQIRIVNLDALTYAGNLANLADVLGDPRHEFVRGDVADRAAVAEALRGVDAIVHFAAESHVDRSIEDAGAFVRTNILGTHVLLEAARHARVGRFLHVSTDEVYGSLEPPGRAREDSPLRPSSPYAASKAAADLLVAAYARTYGLDAVITRSSNNFGPYQFPEKLIPFFAICALEDRPLPLYGDGGNVRDWLHVEDHCAALEVVLSEGRSGAVYNIAAGNEWTNFDLSREILRRLGKPESLLRRVSDRPGHDRRYALDASRIRTETSWEPQREFGEALDETLRWYRDHRDWWEAVRTGEYRRFYEAWYGQRLPEEDG
jgi:dTDP-glucose 4,6-dehydratase